MVKRDAMGGQGAGEDCGLLGDKSMLRVKILASISAIK